MLVEVQPGTYINPGDVVAIEEDGYYLKRTWRDRSYITVGSGARFRVDDKTAEQVRAILWPDNNQPRRLSEHEAE